MPAPRFKVIITALVNIAFLLTCGPSSAAPPGRAASLKSFDLRGSYCLSDEKIAFKIENISDDDLFIGITVEKQNTDGTWLEFCPDIHQQRTDTKAMVGIPLHKGAIKPFLWEFKKAGAFFPLEAGKYKLIGYINQKDEAPGREVMIGEFALETCPEGKKISEPKR
jgi:hypothetical protein